MLAFQTVRTQTQCCSGRWQQRRHFFPPKGSQSTHRPLVPSILFSSIKKPLLHAGKNKVLEELVRTKYLMFSLLVLVVIYPTRYHWGRGVVTGTALQIAIRITFEELFSACSYTVYIQSVGVFPITLILHKFKLQKERETRQFQKTLPYITIKVVFWVNPKSHIFISETLFRLWQWVTWHGAISVDERRGIFLSIVGDER